MEKTEMKRTFLKVLPFAAALLLATSCSKDDNNSVDEIVNGGEQIETVTKTFKTLTVKGKVNKSISKVTTNQDETALAFEGNEQFTFGSESADVYGTINFTNADGNYEATINYTDEVALLSVDGFTATLGSNPETISGPYDNLATAVKNAYYVIPFKVEKFSEDLYLLSRRSLSKDAERLDIVVNLQSAFIKALSAEETTLGGTPIIVEADKYYVVPVGKAMGISGNNTLAGKIYNLGTKVFAFSVSAEKKVAFSSGNLQKVGSQYQFAASQTEYVGAESGEKIDLFEWEENFGSHISDGKNTWYALSREEWEYLKNNHTKQLKTVYNVNGLVILPDECTASISDDWATLEAAGAVFLPCGTTSEGKYWSSSSPRSAIAFYFYFNSGGDVYETTSRSNNWYAVRLVRDAQ